MWDVIELLLGDYIDAFVFLLILAVMILLAGSPAYCIVRICRIPSLRKIAPLVGGGLFGLLGILYFATLPTDYIRAMGWRQKLITTTRDGFDRSAMINLTSSRYKGSDRDADVSSFLHYNIKAAAAMDCYLIEKTAVVGPVLGDPNVLKNILRSIGALLGIPAMVVKFLIFNLLWTPLLYVYWLVCPFLIAVLACAVQLFKRHK